MPVKRYMIGVSRSLEKSRGFQSFCQEKCCVVSICIFGKLVEKLKKVFVLLLTYMRHCFFWYIVVVQRVSFFEILSKKDHFHRNRFY